MYAIKGYFQAGVGPRTPSTFPPSTSKITPIIIKMETHMGVISPSPTSSSVPASTWPSTWPLPRAVR